MALRNTQLELIASCLYLIHDNRCDPLIRDIRVCDIRIPMHNTMQGGDIRSHSNRSASQRNHIVGQKELMQIAVQG